MTTLETIYKGFQENPNRLTYSTNKLQKQFNATESEIKEAKRLYRQCSNDFVVAQALTIYEPVFEDVMNFYDPKPNNSHKLDDLNNWQVKQKWVKNKETGESTLYVRQANPEDLKSIGEGIISQMKDYSPKYPKIEREPVQDPHLLVISLADVHLGKYSSIYETGDEYNRKTAIEKTLKGVKGILDKAKGFNIDTILLIVGNDILHSDTKIGTTTKGTPLDTEGLWHENFMLAKDLYVRIIETLLPVGDVYVQHNQSNHDEMSGFFLAQTVAAWFRLNENVTFDISPKYRKYFQYGKNLIGSSHGEGKEELYPLLMAQEAAQEWGESEFRYWYLHHYHHKKSKEYIGVEVEYLRSPSPADGWHDKNGFVNKPGLDGFIHCLENGQVCRVTQYL